MEAHMRLAVADFFETICDQNMRECRWEATADDTARIYYTDDYGNEGHEDLIVCDYGDEVAVFLSCGLAVDATVDNWWWALWHNAASRLAKKPVPLDVAAFRSIKAHRDRLRVLHGVEQERAEALEEALKHAEARWKHCQEWGLAQKARAEAAEARQAEELSRGYEPPKQPVAETLRNTGLTNREWRKFARTCLSRVMQEDERGQPRGNPLCGYCTIGMRCMQRKCPKIWRKSGGDE